MIARMMVGDAEEWLAGNVAGVIKVGDTVHRQVGAWTPAVHALLDHLAPRLPHIPRVLGFDEQGREVLDFMPGRVIDQSRESLTEAQLLSIVGWTRDFHAAVAGFTHPGPWRYFPVPEPTLIGHNDIAPYNSCFDGDALVGVFDWDLSGPTTPLNELAFIAWNCVPLWADIGAASAARRVAMIADAYGGFEARELLVAVPGRIQLMMDGIVASAAAGDPGMANLVAGGEPESDRVSLAGLRDRIPGILSQLP
jgi:hypothetical protein